MEILKVSKMKSLCPLCDYLDQRKFRKVSITMATVMLLLTICRWLYKVVIMSTFSSSKWLHQHPSYGPKMKLNWTNKIYSEFLCKATEILENIIFIRSIQNWFLFLFWRRNISIMDGWRDWWRNFNGLMVNGESIPSFGHHITWKTR